MHFCLQKICTSVFRILCTTFAINMPPWHQKDSALSCWKLFCMTNRQNGIFLPLFHLTSTHKVFQSIHVRVATFVCTSITAKEIVTLPIPANCKLEFLVGLETSRSNCVDARCCGFPACHEYCYTHCVGMIGRAVEAGYSLLDLFSSLFTAWCSLPA